MMVSKTGGVLVTRRSGWRPHGIIAAAVGDGVNVKVVLVWLARPLPRRFVLAELVLKYHWYRSGFLPLAVTEKFAVPH